MIRLAALLSCAVLLSGCAATLWNTPLAQATGPVTFCIAIECNIMIGSEPTAAEKAAGGILQFGADWFNEKKK